MKADQNAHVKPNTKAFKTHISNQIRSTIQQAETRGPCALSYTQSTFNLVQASCVSYAHTTAQRGYCRRRSLLLLHRHPASGARCLPPLNNGSQLQPWCPDALRPQSQDESEKLQQQAARMYSKLSPEGARQSVDRRTSGFFVQACCPCEEQLSRVLGGVSACTFRLLQAKTARSTANLHISFSGVC